MRAIINKTKTIEGTVRISGAKNSAVAIIPAATMADEPITLKNIPDIADVQTLISILKKQGFNIDFKNNILKLSNNKKVKTSFDDEVSKLRGSVYFLGAFISKYHKIKISKIGGCNLGERPIDYHLDGLNKLNIKVKTNENNIILKTRKIIGNEISFKSPSVGATINLMLASVKAYGRTILRNSSTEPEVVDVGNFLKTMGAKIDGLGTKTIIINGVKKLYGCEYAIISDRIEAGTYMALATLNQANRIRLKNINPKIMGSIIYTFEKMGMDINTTKNTITISRKNILNPVKIETLPYPGFPTDLSPIFSACLINANGTSYIEENIYHERISHVPELKKLGVDIYNINNQIIINGTSRLRNARLTAHDLRCSAALLIAGLQVNESVIIENIDYLFRGYENIINKLKALNINIVIN